MNTIVEIADVSKAYGSVIALDGISLRLEQNKIYGLLGRNGAGKTTLMHILTAQLFSSKGLVRLFGEAPYENDNVLRRVCFIKESQQYPKSLRVSDVLELSASFFPEWDRDFAYALAEEFQLPLRRRMKKLSRGMLSAAGIVVGLASRAPLTIFDEPYLGLDAVSRNLFYDRLLEDYGEHPRTIILSSHLIDEVSRMLEHVVLIDEGRILLDEPADDLRGMAYTVTGNTAKAQAFMEGRDVLHREPFGGLTSFTVKGRVTAELRRAAAEKGLELGPVSLQQLVIHLTKQRGEEIKEGAGV